jgi:hypothetical protein
MAEFESGYCTGCGVKARRWGHRPYCWRKVSMMLGMFASRHPIDMCRREMHKHWRIRSIFLVNKKHMYYPIGPSDDEQ